MSVSIAGEDESCNDLVWLEGRSMNGGLTPGQEILMRKVLASAAKPLCDSRRRQTKHVTFYKDWAIPLTTTIQCYTGHSDNQPGRTEDSMTDSEEKLATRENDAFHGLR